MRRKGWIVWTWGKMGGLLVFMGMMIMILTAYSYTTASCTSQAANQLSQELKNLILDVYDSPGGMSFEHELPPSLEGEAYSVEIVNKSGDTVGIITRTRKRMGGSSLSVPLSKGSFGVLEPGKQLHYICIVKHNGTIYIGGSRCE